MSNELDIIRGARELLADRRHWHQGSAESEDGTAICAVRAITCSARIRRHHWDEHVAKAAWKSVEAHVPGGRGLSIYNDDPSTTHQDILDLFDKTLASLGGWHDC